MCVCVNVVYDVLTGKIEQKLEEHRACVRDVSWHPYINSLISSSVCLPHLLTQLLLL